MEIRTITAEGVSRHEVDDLPRLLKEEVGVLWVDVPVGDPDAEAVLGEVFGFHPKAVQDCVHRAAVPKVHVYADHSFVVLHAPEQGMRGHIHYVEIDQFVGERYLVTVHGPVNAAVNPAAMRVETDAVAARVDSGRFVPATGYELSTAVVSALTARMRDHLSARTTEVWSFEQEVTAGQMGDAEQFLDGMFRVRHGLLTVRTMSSLSAQVYGRMQRLAVFGPAGQALLDNNVDQFERLATMARSQEDYLQGVIEFYQTRTNTKMTIAAERLAVIAAVTLPVTALSSVMGMNVIVNSHSDPVFLAVLGVVMLVMSVLLLFWAKRHGWW
jgi:Mg2+ and Co2+ transporter CorA